MSNHARLGPSNARWPHCPGSVREEANYTDVAGAAAIDGTGSHLLLEMCLENNVAAIQYDQQIIGANHHDNPGGWLVDIGRCQRVQMCLDYVQRRVKELKAQFPDSEVTVEAESKADPGGYYLRKDWWGTVDITIRCGGELLGEDGKCFKQVHFLEVIDYKDGRGWVGARDNTQLLSYLGGKMRPFIGSGPELVRPFHTDRVSNCRMTIVQPKTNPVVRYQCSTDTDEWMCAEYVMKEVDRLSDAANATDDPEAPCFSGKHCQWCKANPKRGGHCVTATEKSIKVVTDMSNTSLATLDASAPMFEQITKVIADPKSLTSDQLGEMLSAEPAMMAAFDACRAEIKARIDAGEHVNGYAMRPGKKSRKWNEPEDVIVKKLKARKLKLVDIYPPKLISPAQVLKLTQLTDAQKKKIEADLISDMPGKDSLQKVEHNVVQSSTTELDSVQMMFGDVADVTPEISFF